MNPKEEPWIDAFRTRLENHSEPVDARSWERLMQQRRHQREIRRRWLMAACLVALLGVGLGTYGLWSSSVPEAVQATASGARRSVYIPNPSRSLTLAQLHTKSPQGMALPKRVMSAEQAAREEWEAEEAAELAAKEAEAAERAAGTVEEAEREAEVAAELAVATGTEGILGAEVAGNAKADKAGNAGDNAGAGKTGNAGTEIKAGTEDHPEASSANLEATSAQQKATSAHPARPFSSPEAQLAQQIQEERRKNGRKHPLSLAMNGTLSNGVQPLTNYNVEMAGFNEMKGAMADVMGLNPDSLDAIKSRNDLYDYTNKLSNPTYADVLNSSSVSYYYEHHRPVSFGLSLRKNLAPSLALESGFFATWMRSDIYYANNQSNKLGERTLWYVGIPLKANWLFFQRRLVTLYASAGGAVEKCVSAKTTGIKPLVLTSAKDIPLQWSANAAVGVQFNMLPSLSLFVDPGLSYYFNDGSLVSTVRKDRPLQVDVLAGLRFSW